MWVWAIAHTSCEGLLQLDVTGGFTVHPPNRPTRFSGSVVGYLCQISIPVLAPVNIYLDALKYSVSVSFICNKIPPFLGNRKKTKTLTDRALLKSSRAFFTFVPLKFLHVSLEKPFSNVLWKKGQHPEAGYFFV